VFGLSYMATWVDATDFS